MLNLMKNLYPGLAETPHCNTRHLGVARDAERWQVPVETGSDLM